MLNRIQQCLNLQRFELLEDALPRPCNGSSVQFIVKVAMVLYGRMRVRIRGILKIRDGLKELVRSFITGASPHMCDGLRTSS
jgi:hypothetical protein